MLPIRTATGSTGIDFSASQRKTKRLVEFEGAACDMGGRRLFSDLNFILTAGSKVGLVGPNGSGKTTLVSLLTGALAPDSGTVRLKKDVKKAVAPTYS